MNSCVREVPNEVTQRYEKYDPHEKAATHTRKQQQSHHDKAAEYARDDGHQL